MCAASGSFLDANHIAVTADDGSRKVVKFAKAIIAAGSEPVNLPFIPQDPRIVDSTGALELRQIPKKMLVIGGGIIGLEMATVYSTLGSRIDVVEMLDGLMPGADRDLVKVWREEERQALRQDHAQDQDGRRRGQGRRHSRALRRRRSTGEPQVYDMVLVAVGRSPNGKLIGAQNAGVTVSDRGFIAVDKQMRTNVPHIFAIGDLVGQPMLAHKAVHEAHVAAEVAAGHKAAFDAKQIPSVAYTDPEIAWAGKTEDQLKAEGVKFGKAVFPWAASGRAIANGRDEGFTKLLFDSETHRIVGGGIVGTHAGDLICGSLPCRRDGRGAVRHRQDDPSASDAGRVDRHGGRSVRGHLHRSAAAEKAGGLRLGRRLRAALPMRSHGYGIPMGS